MNAKRKVVLGVAALALLSTSAAQAFYNPYTGRWLSRDPIGERGGANLHGCARNDVINSIDVLGLQKGAELLLFKPNSPKPQSLTTVPAVPVPGAPPPAPQVTLVVTFDSGWEISEYLKQWWKQLDFLRNAISECQRQYGLCHNVVVVEQADWLNFPQAPSGGYAFGWSAGQPGNGQVPVRVTDHPILRPNGSSAAGAGGPDHGIVLNPSYQASVLAHELGHVGDYACGANAKDPGHSTEKDHIMYTPSGDKVDRPWCETVANLAK